MNFLAHLYLAGDDPDGIVGHLLGDFVRGRDLEAFPEAVRAGILLHRSIDAFTDAHPVVWESKARISPIYRRYAGPLVDVFYDHFLARDWPRYAAVPLDGFCEELYGLLRREAERLPFPVDGLTQRMIAQDWLRSYQSVDGIGQALGRLSRRVRRENTLAEAASELRAAYEGLEADFERFFPELVAHVESASSRPIRITYSGFGSSGT
jgi:acyl carrier protein phosphodiesterase